MFPLGIAIQRRDAWGERVRGDSPLLVYFFFFMTWIRTIMGGWENFLFLNNIKKTTKEEAAKCTARCGAACSSSLFLQLENQLGPGGLR